MGRTAKLEQTRGWERSPYQHEPVDHGEDRFRRSILVLASLLKLNLLGSESVVRPRWVGAMENLNGLLSAAFLILMAAAAAVTGSMVVLGLFDRLFSKKKGPAPSPEIPRDHEQDDEDDRQAFRNARRADEEVRREPGRVLGRKRAASILGPRVSAWRRRRRARSDSRCRSSRCGRHRECSATSLTADAW